MGRRYKITDQNNHNLTKVVMEAENENCFEGFAKSFDIKIGLYLYCASYYNPYIGE